MAAPGALLRELRKVGPLVMCIQNYVAMDLSANVLLAAGASPAMVNALEEVADFCRVSAALSVNVGTALTPHWVEAMDRATKAAVKGNVPWVLDPVGMGATAHRNRITAALMTHRPTVVRGNASEILALAAELGAGAPKGGVKGVDSTDAVDDARQAAIDLAQRFHCVIAVSGAVDLLTDGRTVIRVHNGHPLLTRITAAGCALSALCAAYVGVARGSALPAVIAAFAHYGVAAERAAALPEVRGPGTLRVHLLDALHTLTPEDLETGARVTAEPL